MAELQEIDEIEVAPSVGENDFDNKVLGFFGSLLTFSRQIKALRTQLNLLVFAKNEDFIIFQDDKIGTFEEFQAKYEELENV